ncbi:MAG: RNA methyltransferase, partial [Bdellovibrionota bacterium]
DAKAFPSSVSYADYRRELSDPARSRPVIVVLGTGWGVSDSFYPEVDRILAPIYGPEGSEGYNHLSVRAAAATILDRLLGL